jgi:hypothetical protein
MIFVFGQQVERGDEEISAKSYAPRISLVPIPSLSVAATAIRTPIPEITPSVSLPNGWSTSNRVFS